MREITFIDAEVVPETGKIADFGAVKSNGESIHEASLLAVKKFLLELKSDFLCGHNIIEHDMKYLSKHIGQFSCRGVIDTLHLSALLFPQKPYHKLVKDEKLQTDELNNPINDSKKARDLFYDEVEAFRLLPEEMKRIYYILLGNKQEFKDFFLYMEYKCDKAFGVEEIRSYFFGKICEHANIEQLIHEYGTELAYCLSLIHADDDYSITPPWVFMRYPYVDVVMNILRGTRCAKGCVFCDEMMDAVIGLKRFFGYDAYRSFEGVPLQEKAVKAAVDGNSLLAVFPTGGGKSITFQVPALMAGKNTKSLTVVISPLQSLMKDQVDNLEKNYITDAVTINGLLDPIERMEAIRRVESGEAFILYISPESLRSKSIEKLLQDRKITRFVIDEAHCFSAWGQDFRVDYLYIAEFIKKICERKNLEYMIPVSCFTATAKQNVIDDIREYFKKNLNLDLNLFTASSERKNLTYKVIKKEESEKYEAVRNLLEYNKCPTIIYVSRTNRSVELAKRLTEDGYEARPYNGKMDKTEKSQNQDAFTRGDVDIMVATSAFGMGVDKKDVGMVIHYDISDSLENYVQEAGRAGRDQNINAKCFVLFNDEDLNKHFLLLNQTKISIQEIQQVWKAIKDATKTRSRMSNSALEIARVAGWDESVNDIETRVRTAIQALENAGYIKRGQNMPRVYADSIMAKNTIEAAEKIKKSGLFSEIEEEQARRIISNLISARSRNKGGDQEAEARVDYISDHLGIEKSQILHLIQLMRQAKILSDAKDLIAYAEESGLGNKSANILFSYIELERFILSKMSQSPSVKNIKELNELAEENGVKNSSPEKIKTILNFWTVKGLTKKLVAKNSKDYVKIRLMKENSKTLELLEGRWSIAEFILSYLDEINVKKESVIEFSVLQLMEEYNFRMQLMNRTSTPWQIEDALYYLSKIGALKLEGGFLVTYNALSIERLIKDNKIRYKADDYKSLKNYYKQKTEMIHIVGEYAKKMMEDYKAALKFVDDYFRLEYSSFLKKYFKGPKGDEIQKNVTPEKFRQLFGQLSPSQLSIINDKDTKYIVVAAGPGSGKTRILVHKLAALLLMEDIKHEQLLMVTFSRAAATEFKKRLIGLINNSANFVEIKTFHSYCFDLLGQVGNVEKSTDIISRAALAIESGEVESSKITRMVLVIDEAQDMDKNEYRLIRALIAKNEDMRVIAVGDDDQNIYSFRGSDSKYMRKLLSMENSKMYELVENYRSSKSIVEFSNDFVRTIENRMKKIPISSVSKEKGSVTVIRYHSSNLVVPVVKSMLDKGIYGSTCILTRTNEEAIQIFSLLEKNEIKVGMIQKGDKYELINLLEIRSFIEELRLTDETYVIRDEVWDNAKNVTLKKFSRSENFELLKQIIADFEETAGKIKYKTDFMLFIKESSEEDFYRNEERITVSTIHKAKGREFDHVIMVLKDFTPDSVEDKRQLYVGMTRARKTLTIHYNGEYFEKKTGFLDKVFKSFTYEYDNNVYPPSELIVFQLSYKDVYLSYFYQTKKYVEALSSGDSMKFDENGCMDEKGNRVLIFSGRFKEEMKKFINIGYRPFAAKVNNILFWKQEDFEHEALVVFPQLEFIRDGIVMEEQR